jgi:hypothetical protein
MRPKTTHWVLGQALIVGLQIAANQSFQARIKPRTNRAAQEAAEKIAFRVCSA